MTLSAGIGADDMFQLMTEWQNSNHKDSTETRMSNTLRSAAVSITITSLTDLLAFCIGATSPFLSVRNFCACSGNDNDDVNVAATFERCTR
jgi:patched domain-containing protein